jgi:AcrR family transcriptional regulator
MSKGDLTKQLILNRAVRVASTLGLDGLTIGKLAEQLGLSKSGLFAHFDSKEGLQIEVLRTASAQFTDEVIRPALKAPRGKARLDSLFEHWMRWATGVFLPGGCLFVTAAVELDDRPGPARDFFAMVQKQWFETRARVVRTAVESGELKADTDSEQFSHDLYAIMLGYHYAARLLEDPRAQERARNAYRTLVMAASR